MSGVGYEWNQDSEAMRLAALEDPAKIRFEITGRNGSVFTITYEVHPRQRARIVSQLEHHDPPPTTIEQFAMDEPVRVDLPVPDYLLMVYGIECVPDGGDFPDQAGEPDAF